MLFILVLTSVGAWLYGLSVLDEEPRALSASQRITSITTLTRYALISADTSYRFDLIMALAQREGLNILPKEPSDRVEPLEGDRLNDLILENVRSSLGKDTMLARRINGMPGLWVSFKIDEDEYWLRCERSSNPPRLGTNWIFWFGGMLFVCTLFTVLLTNRLIDPLSRLSSYARQLGRGILPEPLPLDGPREIREVNESFNVMVSDLKRLQSDRELLLAGVSHDLRTPITRLRLEVELAPISEETRNAMCSDLDQMESIVKQFMAYVRQGETELSVVDISSTLREVIAANRLSTQPDVTLKVSIDDNLEVRANPTDLARAIQNMIVNAGKYGRSTDGRLNLTIVLRHLKKKSLAELIVSDDGKGLPANDLERVLRPFERGDTARGNASGTGLGLSIVTRVAKAGGGSVRLVQNIPNGLSVQMIMPLVPSSSLVRQSGPSGTDNQSKA
ncbi:ATP-binding protein [uncultured Parasutterella sp.]|nr:ATP-binding protein [uncultured Parasutterella sp.]